MTLSPLGQLLLQILVIVLLALLAGRVARALGQPAVIGEILAGLLLGPSALGAVAPGLAVALFPVASLGTLSLVSQLGVVLYLFLVGLELEPSHLRSEGRAAVIISAAGMVVPFALGLLLAQQLYGGYAGAGVSRMSFALFIGVALSITAFPVLVRILEERGLMESATGRLAVVSAALGDLAAWSLLALVIAVAKAGTARDFCVAVGATLLLSVVLLLGVRRWLKPRLAKVMERGELPPSVFAGLLLFVIACALVTEWSGVHALCGAFLAGLALPAGPALREELRSRLESVSLLLLLPLFFASTGLRTSIGELHSSQDWLVCAGIVAVACVGKWGGVSVAAQACGISWRESSRLGVLMNTRGLMELLVLNVGYELGVLPARLYTMLVVMALVTTFATGPLLSLLDRSEKR